VVSRATWPPWPPMRAPKTWACPRLLRSYQGSSQGCTRQDHRNQGVLREGQERRLRGLRGIAKRTKGAVDQFAAFRGTSKRRVIDVDRFARRVQSKRQSAGGSGSTACVPHPGRAIMVIRLQPAQPAPRACPRGTNAIGPAGFPRGALPHVFADAAKVDRVCRSADRSRVPYGPTYFRSGRGRGRRLG
jgi:hypothetical protein